MWLFLLAVLGVVLAVNVVAGLAYRASIGRGIMPYEIDARGEIRLATARVPTAVFVWTTLATIAIIGFRSVLQVYALRAGGDAVARMAGGRPVDRSTTDPDERRLLNVADEMAIASGITIPRVYVLPDEPAINAFAAGYAANQAAIAVTEGALRQLTRDELQGVVGHEFSHVLNGDMRLNVNMIGVLAGILFIGEIGEFLMRSASDTGGRHDRRRHRGRSSRGGLALVGLGLMIVGYVGLFFGRLIKASASRQREFLADASSVQFTRNPQGIAGALTVIGALGSGSLVQARAAETLSHMFFAQGVTVWLESMLATHPALDARIQRIDSRFVASDYLARRTRELEAAAAPPRADEVEAAPARAAFAPPSAAAAPGVAAVVASVGRPTPQHVDYAARLLAELPDVVRDTANSATAAPALVLALALSPEDLARKQQLALLEPAGSEPLGREADRLAGHVRTLPPGCRLPVVALALASLRTLDQARREALLRDLQTLVDADRRVTLEEFVLLTIVRQHLGPRAMRAEPVKYRSILEVDGDARLVLSLLAHAGSGDTGTAYARGLQKLGMPGTVTPLGEIAFTKVGEALARLRRLAPFVKRTYLEACVETAMADDRIRLAEAELLRAIATALDCPVPPILDAVDPTTLA